MLPNFSNQGPRESDEEFGQRQMRNFAWTVVGSLATVAAIGSFVHQDEPRETSLIPRDAQHSLMPSVYQGYSLNGERVSFEITPELYKSSKTASNDRSLSITDNRILYYKAIILDDASDIKQISLLLTQGAGTAEDKAQHLLNWIRTNITYDKKEDNSNKRYLRTPVETLYERAGDSEDLSILFSAMCKSIGIDPILLDFGNVVLVGIEGNYKGSCLQVDNKSFYIADLGAVATEFSNIGSVKSWLSYEQPHVIRVFTDKNICLANENGQESVVVLSICEYEACCNSKVSRRFMEGQRASVENFISSKDPLIKEMANALTSGTGTEEEKLQNILSWVVKYIPYVHDVDGKNQLLGGDYWRYPIQTLFEELGDCEDTAYVFASLALASDHLKCKVGIAVYDDHICPIVPGSFEGEYFEYEGEKYYIAETASDGATKIGEPSASKKRSARIFIFNR